MAGVADIRHQHAGEAIQEPRQKSDVEGMLSFPFLLSADYVYSGQFVEKPPLFHT